MDYGLNPEQRKAVETLNGPLLVLAGAGSGKTRVVTFRIAELIRSGVAPERILAVTFTNKAANEMQQRIRPLIKTKSKQQPEISTFHSYCVKVLRRQIHHLGYASRFTIYDRGDQESVARAVLRESRVPNELMRPGDLLAILSRWKTAGLGPTEAEAQAATDRDHLAAMGYRRYLRALKNANAVDFDDLLRLCGELFQKHPQVLAEERDRFDHLLVDEYQDTSMNQYRIIKALAMQRRNLCVVGDDDQSIYGWRGAEVEHILRFTHDWPDAKVIHLGVNYRSTNEIIQFASRLIGYNRVRHPKSVTSARPGGERPRIVQSEDELKEARDVVGDIARRLRQPGVEPKDFAILFRTNDQPRVFETELRTQNIPYQIIGGSSFYDRTEVKDVLAYLRVAAAPHDDVALLRVLNKPPRGIGDVTITKLTQEAARSQSSIWKLLTNEAVPQTGPLRGFVTLVHELRDRLKAASSLAAFGQELVSRVRYSEEVRRHYDTENERAERMQLVSELMQSLATFEGETAKASLTDFIDQMTLGDREPPGEKERKLKRNTVVLMTYHSAKGLEFPYVYMVGMEEGILPHRRSVADNDASIDEERRLCYVGITRAMDALTFSLARSRTKWGKGRETIPSRFLFEVLGQADSPRAKEVIAKSLKMCRESSDFVAMAEKLTKPPIDASSGREKINRPGNGSRSRSRRSSKE